MRDVLRACISANLAILTIRKALAQGKADSSGLTSEIGKPYHAWWIVPSVRAVS